MNSIQTYLRKGHQVVRGLWVDERVRRIVQAAAYILAGFCFSAASLGGHMQPLTMAFVWACSGGASVLAAVGGIVGYWCFWPSPLQAVCWVALGFLGRIFTKNAPRERFSQLLIPATAALVVAVSGVAFQFLAADDTPVGVFLVRVVLAGFASWLFDRVAQGRNPVLEWMAGALAVLALAQVVPLPYMGLGFVAVGAVTVCGAFPAAAMAGLALDLAQTGPVPMTAVAVLGSLIRFLPRCPKWLLRLTPGLVYVLLLRLWKTWDLYPLPGLVLGGILGSVLSGPARVSHRRGETGVAQVRLEIAAGVLSQTQLLISQVPQVPVDEDSLIVRAAERACNSCAARKNCKDTRRIGQLPGVLLHKPLLHVEELPIQCRKSGRLLAELHRSQEQLRSIRADRERQQEYRAALTQQYQFLADFLQDLSDRLASRVQPARPFYEPLVQVYGNRPRPDNGDRVTQFSGTACKYYVVLCDGMGTGLGAVQEGRIAADMLQKLLTAGFPAEYALRSINSLCALRDRAGAATVDLAELELYSGKVTLYKWGAAPSYLAGPAGVEKIGTAGPPPGLSVELYKEQVHAVSIRRGQTLVLVSDGVPEEAAMQCCVGHADRSPGELARSILTCSLIQGQDDATVVTIRLTPAADGSCR